MMDREKVIGGLAACTGEPHDCAGHTCPYFDFDDSEVDYGCRVQMELDALELLKEQDEPKQIVRKQCKIEHNDGSIDYFAEWYCPHCNLLILRGFDNPSIKFCYKCGKPILWESR